MRCRGSWSSNSICSSETPNTFNFSLAVAAVSRLLLSSFWASITICSEAAFSSRSLFFIFKQIQVMYPLDESGLEVVLGRRELGTEQIDQRVSDRDFLAPLDPHLLDERIESRTYLG